ncbi:MAG: transposase family protein [Ardenticatenaceae bacterium]|nr:transposase family protein [Ardenticatenaceae bacterium]
MILAKLAGEQTMSGIAQWARRRRAWLGEGLKLSRPTLPCANSSTLIRDQGEVEELNTVWVIISRPRRRHRVGRPALQATRLGAGVATWRWMAKRGEGRGLQEPGRGGRGPRLGSLT